jgi:hypothetical protein
VIYDLSHLTQSTRRVYGPIQDDEALLLYAFIRCTGARIVLEAGGQTGYSAANFLAAVGQYGMVFTVDTQPVPRMAENHAVIQADIADVDLSHVPRCDLVFLDAHCADKQHRFIERAIESGVVGEETTVAIHDTGLHDERFVPWAVPCGDSWAHQPEDRRLVEMLRSNGWVAVHVHDDDSPEPRHGLTILQRPRSLA